MCGVERLQKMEQINDLEMAINIVKQGKDLEEKTLIVNKLLEGTINLDSESGRQLLHRRALLVTELHAQKIWPFPDKE